MPVQTSYSTQHAPAFEGQKASTSELFNSRSYFAEGDNIVPGRGVVYGTNAEKQVALPGSGATDGDFAGITLYELNRVHDDDGIPQNQDRPLTVVNHGPLWVRAQNGASVKDAVHLVINDAGGDTVGGFRSSSDDTNTVEITGAKFITSAAAGELAQVSITRE